MLRQAYEGRVPSPQSKKEPFFQYLLLRTLATTELGLCIMRHACLANNAWLKLLMSWKPIPPSSLRLQRRCQETQAIFFLLEPLLHQNSTIALVSLSQRSLGSLKTDMAYTGRARAIDFSKLNSSLLTDYLSLSI